MSETSASDLSGDPLVGIAKDWAAGRKPAELCQELYIRLCQAYGVLATLCRMQGVTLDEALAAASVADPPETGGGEQ